MAGGVWNCPSSLLTVQQDPNTSQWKYYTNGVLVTGPNNAYTGLIDHARYDRRTNPLALPRVLSWSERHFSRPSGVPVQWCSIREQTFGGVDYNGSAQPGWHGDDARPTGFVDGHASILRDPNYTSAADTTFKDAIYRANKPVHAMRDSYSFGDYELSEK